MSTWVVGDVQGCWRSLQALLGRCEWDPDADALWLAGDLCNRGPAPLEVLRFCVRNDVVAVLGNHDLHLLGRAAGVEGRKRRDTLEPVLEAPDRAELLGWLRARPLLHRQDGWTMVHAGLLPQWTLEDAAAAAREVEAALQGPGAAELLRHRKDPDASAWRADLSPSDRRAVALNAFTNLRTCTPEGEMCLEFSGPPEEAPEGCVPWFEVPGRRSAGHPVIFGHWAALGHRMGPDWIATDSGCVWGNRLTAVRLEDRRVVQVEARG